MLPVTPCILEVAYSVLCAIYIITEPKTPVDPCDRVKFILETEEGEGEVGEGRRESHSLFTELEELRCDHHNRLEAMEWYVTVEKDTSVFMIIVAIYFTSKTGKPLYNGRNDLSCYL